MSEKKNIDRLFQEKFKDFEAAPPEFVWDNIQEALQEKKKKRVVPIWIRLSGVAAVLLIGLFLGWQYFSSNNPNTNPVVIENPATQPSQPLKIAPSQIPIPNGGTVSDSTNGATNPINSAVVSNNAGTGTLDNSPEKNSSNNSLNGNNAGKAGTATSATAKRASSAFSTKNNAVAHSGGNQNQKGSNTSKRNNAKGNRHLNLNNAATGVAATSATQNNNNSSEGTSGNRNAANRNSGNGGRFTNPANKNNISIAQGSNPSNTNSANKQGSIVNGVTTSATADGSKAGQSKVNNNGVGVGTTNSATGITNNNAGNAANPANNSSNGNNNTTANQTSTTIDKTLPVNEQAVAETKVDTTTAKPENELEKLLREKLNGEKENKDDDQLADAETSKWKLKPQIAPLFYNSLSQGSPIDGQFAGNSKSYDKDLSYGLGINYEVSSRLSIRSGVNAINLSYATQGVEFYASLSGQTSNVAARTSNATIVVQNQAPATSSASPTAMFADVLPKETFNGSMVQTTGYVEVPVELSYALLNKKFGIDIIGGVSTLFLNDNNVSVVSNQGFATSIGEAENLNNIHFSTNVGIGFKYKFFKAFEANFEPMFKYQLNTYSRDSGNFKPYFIGLYSGISFSF